MSRFAGFQSEKGVAVLDTMTGELVFYPFDGGSPTVLRQPTAAELEAPATEIGDASPALESWSRRQAVPDDHRMLRSERRLKTPRPLVIRDLGSDEVASVKAARIAKEARLLSELVPEPSRLVSPVRADSTPEDEA